MKDMIYKLYISQVGKHLVVLRLKNEYLKIQVLYYRQ